MTMTRDQLTAQARDIADATDTQRWPDATVLAWAGIEMDRTWANILNANNAIRMNVLTVAEDASGQFLKSALDTGTGDTMKRHYRILSISDGTQMFYRQVEYKDFPSIASPTILPYIWYELGTSIQVLPASSANVLTVMVNYRPPNAAQVASGSSIIDLPDGFEMVVAYHTAAQLAMKGGIETAFAQQYRATGSDLETELLMDIRRAGTKPVIARAMDSPADYGSF